MVDHVEQCSESAVVIEAALLVSPEARERRRPVHPWRRTIGLECVDTHLCRSMQVVARLREERRDVTRGAPPLAGEECLPSIERGLIERTLGRRRRWDRELIEVRSEERRVGKECRSRW